jgi:hypothetical protein
MLLASSIDLRTDQGVMASVVVRREKWGRVYMWRRENEGSTDPDRSTLRHLTE